MSSHKELPKTLGLGALIIYGTGDMLGAGIYGLIGAAAGLMGNMLWLGFALSALAAMLTALTYASLGTRYPKAGGAAYVAEKAFAIPALTYVMGLIVMTSGLVSMAAASRAFVSYAIVLLPSIPEGLVISLFAGGLAVVTFIGMRESSWANIVCTVIELGGLLFIIVTGISYWGQADLFKLPEGASTTFPDSALLLLQGAVLTFYAFIGFEDLLNIAEEVKDPARHFAKGILTAVSLTTLVYIMVSITAVSVVDSAVLSASREGPLVLVVEKTAPWLDLRIFGVVALFAIANTALLNFVMASRLAYGMAREGALPPFFATLHSKRRTPHRAILIIFAAVVVLALLGDLSQLASATSLLLLVVFIVMNIALLKLKFTPSEPAGTFEVPSFVPLLAILICSLLLMARMTAADLRPFLIAGGLFILILASYVFVKAHNASGR